MTPSPATLELRDYFIAHAPAEPQPWFEPHMGACPDEPKFHQAPQEVKDELKSFEYEDWISESEMSAAALEWHMHKMAVRREIRAWTAEQAKQRYVQWPNAWASAMMNAKNARLA